MSDSDDEESPEASKVAPAPRPVIESSAKALKNVDLIESEDFSHFRTRPILLPSRADDYNSSDDDADFIIDHTHDVLKVPQTETNRIVQEQLDGRLVYHQLVIKSYYKSLNSFIDKISQTRPLTPKPTLLVFGEKPTDNELNSPGDYLSKISKKNLLISLKQFDSQEEFVKDVFSQLVFQGFVCRLVWANPPSLRQSLELIMILFRGRFDEPSLNAFYNKAISDANTLPYENLPKVYAPCWIEVWDTSKAMFTCYNPLTGSYDIPDEFRAPIRYNYRTVQFVLAVDARGAVYDVSPYYIITYADLKLRKHPISGKTYRSLLLRGDRNTTPLPRPPQNRSIRISDILREKKFLKSLPKPNCIRFMSQHALYVLANRSGATEMFHPNAKPIGVVCIKGVDMEYYYRSSLVRVASEFNWLKRGFRVKPNQEPARTSRGHPWFRSDQVELAKATLDEDGNIPLNEYSNVYTFRKWMIPEGCVFIASKTEKLGLEALAMELQCPRAIVEFEFNKNKAFPLFGGFIMRKQDYITFFSKIISNAYEARDNEPVAPKKKRQKKVRQVLPGYC